jgi:type I restriction enzyme R subunit
VGFLQAVRVALLKDTSTVDRGLRTGTDREMAIQQIVSRAVVSTEMVDILRAGGIESGHLHPQR